MTDAHHDQPVARADLAAALALLDKRHLVLAIHDVSFPGGDDDIGRGSPYSAGGRGLLRFVRELGFTGVQLGPQGLTSRNNPSPYDGALFARDILSIALPPLAEAGLLPPAALAAALADPPARPTAGVTERADHARAWTRQLAALAAAHGALAAGRAAGDPAARDHGAALAEFAAAGAGWLEPAGLYEALSTVHRTDRTWPNVPGLRVSFAGAHWRTWPTDGDLYARPEPARLAALRDELAARGDLPALRLFGDLQVGISVGDTWAMRGLFLAGYAMGAPPSRTNPAGQPWGYPVLDPALYREQDGQPGPALRLVAARTDAMLRDYDGLRIDHPHGLVCPWVYDAEDPDPLRAVQRGARLFDSPGLADHPRLAALAIARAEQLDPSQPRHADGWVRDLDDAQVRRYSAQLDVVMAAAAARGRSPDDVLCEVLSTQPYPLQRALARYGLGRFRVTQKANLGDPGDVYRSENARPEDWVMLGNHDTPPIWRVAAGWRDSPAGQAQAAYLAGRLGQGDAFAAHLARDPAALVHAKFADLLACPARQVMVFMSDLFGVDEVYNAPGTVDGANWSLRLRPGRDREYWGAAARGGALDLGWSLALALRSRGPAFAREHAALLARLGRGLGRP